MYVVDILVEGLFGPSSLWCALDTLGAGSTSS